MPSGDHFLSAHLTSMLLVKPGPQNPYTERTFMPSRFGRTELQTILKDMFLLFFFRASICKKLPASISSKLCQRSNANTSCCILAHPYLFPLFRMENPAAYIHGVCAWFPRRCEGGWGGSRPQLAYPFPVQFLLNLQKSQDRIHSKFTVPISIHNGKTNLSVGLAVCIFRY